MRNRRDLIKKNYNSNYRQNMLPINWDGDKYQTLERCIWGLNRNSNHMKIQRVFLTWKILQMEMDSNFKKKMSRVGEGGFIPLTCLFYPMLIMYPLRLRGNMISMGYGGIKSLLTHFFLKSLSIYIFKLILVRNLHAAFSCGLQLSSDLTYYVRAIGIYRLN